MKFSKLTRFSKKNKNLIAKFLWLKSQPCCFRDFRTSAAEKDLNCSRRQRFASENPDIHIIHLTGIFKRRREMTEAEFSRQWAFHRKRTHSRVDLGWCLWKLCPSEGTALVALMTWAAELWVLLMMGIRSESSRILFWVHVSVSFLRERVKWPQSH